MTKNDTNIASELNTNGRLARISKRAPPIIGPKIMAADIMEDIAPRASPLLAGPAKPATLLVTMTRKSD